MRRVLLLATLLLVLTSPAQGSEWGGIEPGVSTTDTVRARYGDPTKETHAKVEGYDTTQWIYEGTKAPGGIITMTVDFGLLTPSGYKSSVVRLLKLEPRPLIFGRNTLVQGWGPPDGVGNKDGVLTLFYKDGLFVVLDPAGENAVSMIFSIPQPEPGAKAAPTSPTPAPPKSKQ